jgi:hypothetical protein
MRKTTANVVTPVYARQRSRTPTLPQLNAIDLLASGKTDTEVAELLKLDRTTVSKWRLYDPVFQAALNRRREEVWGAAADRLRSLIPKALDALADGLESKHHPQRMKAAVELLRLASPANALPMGLTDPEAIVREIVANRRAAAAGSDLDDFVASVSNVNLPSFEEHVEQVWQELNARLAESEDAAVSASHVC